MSIARSLVSGPRQAEDNDLPEGWVETTVGIVMELKYGRGLIEIDRRGGAVAVYGSNGVVGHHDVPLTRGATLVIGRKGTVGAVHYSPDPCWPIDTAYYVDAFQGLDPRYAYQVLRYLELGQHDTSTAVPGLNREDAYRQPFRLPPLPEQRRIVAQVEALLARHSAARERLENVAKILKRFRSAVLAAACSGGLTADWRESHRDEQGCSERLSRRALPNTQLHSRRAGRLWGAGVVPELTPHEREAIPESWTWAKVRQLGCDEGSTVQVGPMSMQSREFADAGVPVLNVGCVQWGWIDETKLDFLPGERAGGFDRYRIVEGDVLFTRSGTVGRCAIAGDKQDGYLMTFHLLRVRPDPTICISEYLQFVFQGAEHIRRQTEDAAIGSTRAGFNTNLLGGLDVPLPSLQEQQEIVRRVRALLDLADAVKRRAESAANGADRLPQSILAKALRGELVPTEAELAPQEGREYEPASVLLDRIQAARAAGSQGPGPQRRRRVQAKQRRLDFSSSS